MRQLHREEKAAVDAMCSHAQPEQLDLCRQNQQRRREDLRLESLDMNGYFDWTLAMTSRMMQILGKYVEQVESCRQLIQGIATEVKHLPPDMESPSCDRLPRLINGITILKKRLFAAQVNLYALDNSLCPPH